MAKNPINILQGPLVKPARRRLLSAGALTALAALGGTGMPIGSALAKTALRGQQTASAHRMKLGQFEITALLDGYQDTPLPLLNIDPDLLSILLADAHLPNAPIRIPVNTFLVNTGERLFLIDSGAARGLGPTMGRLPEVMASIGVSPADVDEVLITHAHPDHIGGVLTPEGAALFPNAQLRLARADLAFWANEENEAKAGDRKYRFQVARRAAEAYRTRLRPFDPGEPIAPGIQSIGATGHTVGHTTYQIESDGQKLLAIGDTLHIASVQFSRPEVTIAYDTDQAQARAARRALFDRVARENTLIAAAHLPFPGIGRLHREGASFTFAPLPWQMF